MNKEIVILPASLFANRHQSWAQDVNLKLTLLRVILYAGTGFFGALWLFWMVDPMGLAGIYHFGQLDQRSLNTLQGDLGGLMLTATIFQALYLLKGDIAWAKAAIVTAGSVIISRTLGAMTDGFSYFTLGCLIFEALSIVVLLGVVSVSSSK